MKTKKILKRISIAIISIIVFLIIFIVSLRLPAVQNYIKDKLIVYLENKIKTKVSLEKVYIDFPNSLVMENLYLKGQDVDTLLAVKKLDVGLDMWQLLNSKADITSVDVNGLSANVIRKKDGKFNFDYIINAFATSDKEESSSKPFIISLHKINLKNIAVTFNDQQSGNDIKVYFTSFDTKVKIFDLQKNIYAVNNINLDGLQLKLKQSLIDEVSKNIEEKVDSLSQNQPLKIRVNGIKLTHVNLGYDDEKSKTQANIVFNELQTTINTIDLENNAYNIGNIYLSGANINANLFLPQQDNEKTDKKEAKKSDEKAPKLLLGKLILEDVKTVYNNTAIPPTPTGLDFNHLNFSKINIDLRNFKMEDNQFYGKIKSSEIQEKRGLNIQKFSADFAYEKQQAYLKNLYLETPKTILRDEVILNYNSVEQLSTNLGAVKIMANISNSKIGFSDILNLAPDLKNTLPFNQYPDAILNINAVLKGSINDLSIQNFRASGIDQLKIIASGKIKNATNINQLYYDLKISEASTSSKTIYNLVPKNTIPKNITLPSYFKLSGTAKGNTQVFDLNTRLSSTLGNASLLAKIDMRRKNHELYNINANLQNLQVGKIIQNKDIGNINAQIVAKGESFDVKNANTYIKGNIKSAGYNQYNYQNIHLTGKINRGIYDILLNSKDPNANLELSASGIYTENHPTIKLNGDINRLDIHKLGFYKTLMTIAGNVNGDITNFNPDDLNGYITLQNFAISDGKEIFPVKEVYFRALSTKETNKITLNSQVADIELVGKYKLTQIFGSLEETINEYYQFQKNNKTQKIEGGQYFTFNAKIKNDDLIRRFVPDLESFDVSNISGNYNADTKKIEINAQIPQILYGKNALENTSLVVTNHDQALQYNLYVDSYKGESFALSKINVEGDVANNTVNYTITSKNKDDVIQFLIAGNAKSIHDVTEISLKPDGLKLNYSDWTVADNNKIQFSDKGILAENFKLSHSGSEIFIQSESPIPNSPLTISLKDFQIETITEIIKKDTLLAKGTIDGTAHIKDFTKKMVFNADLNVSDLFVYGSPVGNLNIKAKNISDDIINTNITLSENNNDVKIAGDYTISENNFDLDVDINKIQMKTLQGFSMNAILDTEGYLSGHLKVKGTPENPNILGKIKMNDVGLEIAKVGSDFRKINDEIDFTNRGIEFNHFKIHDKDGNTLAVNGEILTQTYRDFAFNLSVSAKDFKIINSEKSSDAIVYGILSIDALLDVRGNLDLPKVDGRISVSKNTDFTFVLPQTNPSLQEREGIVEFVDQDQIALQKTVETESLNAESRIKGMDVNVNIAVDKEAKLAIVIDKANGDLVKLQGEAELTGGIDPSGKTTLVGVYEVEKGSYELSVSILKRKFDIQKGSTITWTGEPTTANLDITAIYKTEAAPIDLIEQQTGDMTASESNMYKQKIPFNTLLKLNGELLKPEITFDITTDEKNNAVASSVTDRVNTKLTQIRTEEAEMNKQVFALLLLNRFIGENPFQSNTGVSAEMLARQSVSKILSQQLNNIASDLIKVVDLNFNLESTDDYSSGVQNTRTDLNIGISKKLLNDRLKVYIGSNFGLEGEARENENTTNIAGDISVDYSLSKDGRYVLRAYRKNDYQVALQGQIVETGIGFIITLDYDKFKEIFQKSKKRTPPKKEQKVVEFK